MKGIGGALGSRSGRPEIGAEVGGAALRGLGKVAGTVVNGRVWKRRSRVLWRVEKVELAMGERGGELIVLLGEQGMGRGSVGHRMLRYCQPFRVVAAVFVSQWDPLDTDIRSIK